MGYRSDVVCLIYGDTTNINNLLTKYKTTFDAFDDNIIIWNKITDEGNQSFIKLVGNYKWYENYPDVKAWIELMNYIEGEGCEYEFYCVDEDYNDVETRSSENSLGFLSLRREITCDLDIP
jgi:hypothetical protein